MMSGICGNPPGKGTRFLRNGLEFEPKKTYPPDYSNVPSVRDWQMSPFGNERYDLDEIQKAQKKGYKGRFELEKLKKQYPHIKTEPSKFPVEPCPMCLDRERQDANKRDQKRPHMKIRCSKNYLYQPYGPSVVSSLSYSRPETNQPRRYTYLGPSFYAGFQFKVPAPETVPTVPCEDIGTECPRKSIFYAYAPYGPYGEVRVTPDMYTPMGPSVLPIDF